MALLLAAIGFAVSLAGWIWYGAREIGKARDVRMTPMFPSRDVADAATQAGPRT